MQKLNSTAVYQLSLEDLKEALTLYMDIKYKTKINIQSIDEVMHTFNDGLGTDVSHFDGVKIYSNL